jgi:hypothetical protein
MIYDFHYQTLKLPSSEIVDLNLSKLTGIEPTFSKVHNPIALPAAKAAPKEVVSDIEGLTENFISIYSSVCRITKLFA